MVERLRHAIEKAREQRGEAETPSSSHAKPRVEPVSAPEEPGVWEALEEINLDPEHLASSRVVTLEKTDPAHIPFDLLRTRLVKVLRDNGWRRVAVTSASKGCGKTMVSTNLAFSFARQTDFKSLLVDMDMRAPHVASTLGVRNAPNIAWYLSGRSPLEGYLRRYGRNLALALNRERVRDSAEMIHDEQTGRMLNEMIEKLDPDVVIYDLPPMLVGDDAMAFLPKVDCTLLVAAAGQTTAREIEDCERLFSGQTNFLGVLLNKSTTSINREGYEYA